MTRILRFFLFVLVAAVIGCGGGGSSKSNARPGSATIRITWPVPSRLIPIAATKIRVKLSATSGGGTVPAQVANAPAANATDRTVKLTFDALIPGTYKVTAEAFNGDPDTNAALATNSTSIVIVPSQDTNFSVSMDSAVDRFQVTYAPRTTGTPKTFYLAATGAFSDAALKNPITPLFDLANGSTDVSDATHGWDVTVKAVNATNADLLLLRTDGTASPLSFTVDPPLKKISSTVANATNLSGVLNLDTVAEGFPRFAVTYTDSNTTIQYTAPLQVKSSTAVGSGTITITGLPTTRSDDMLSLHAVLTEDPSSGQDQQEITPSDTLVKANSPTVVIPNFSGVLDRGRKFKLTVTLQIRTSDGDDDGSEVGGFIDAAQMTTDSTSLTDAFSLNFSDSSKTGSLTNGSKKISVIADQGLTFSRGGDPIAITSVRAKVGISSTTAVPVSLPAELFAFPATAGSPGDTLTLTYSPRTLLIPGTWTIAPPAAATSPQAVVTGFFAATFGNGGSTLNTGNVNYNIKANSGSIKVGVS